jgi:hypothetical protein
MKVKHIIHFSILTYRLQTRIAERKETAVARLQKGKHISEATIMQLLEGVFSMNRSCVEVGSNTSVVGPYILDDENRTQCL